jgi:hypothetical protein
MSHTPGPWKAVYVGSSDWDLDGPVTEQDWKLAAAAPELLGALKAITAAPDLRTYGLAMQNACIAIARAEGVQS